MSNLIAIANYIGSNLISQAPPVASQEIITELGIQMVAQTTLEDLITEGT
jgi:hypothetical protein